MGQQLSSPITTLHVDRLNSPLFHASAVSMHGWRSTMEDAHNIVPDINGHGIMLFGVYDGHGGSLAAEYLQKVIPSAFKSLQSITDYAQITSILLQVDEDFLATGNDDGAALCIVLGQPWDTERDEAIVGPLDQISTENPHLAIKLVSVNVGDSRAMVIRKSGEFVAITEDHKPNDEKERARIVNAGGFVQSNRVDGNLALSRAMGDRVYKLNSQLPMEQQKVIAVPDFQQHILFRGDVLLVSCDGIFESTAMTHSHVAFLVNESIHENSTIVEPVNDGNTSEKSASGNDAGKSLESANSTAAATTATKTIQNWDPAVVARDIIEQSLLHESRDNHSAMVIHFTTTTPQDLPVKECIPGPFESVSQDQTYTRTYIEDLDRNGYKFEDLKPVIEQIDHAVKTAHVPFGYNEPEFHKILPQIGIHLSPVLPPTRQFNRATDTQPQMANFLFSYLLDRPIEQDGSNHPNANRRY